MPMFPVPRTPSLRSEPMHRVFLSKFALAFPFAYTSMVLSFLERPG